jgi:hypothetical protein
VRSDEKPREVYLAACEAIARRFADDGYRFARSGPHARRSDPPYTFEIGFGSSHYNVAGEHVALRVAATVSSAELRAWRRAADPDRDDSYVAGGWLHRLVADSWSYDEWELGPPETRGARIDDAVAALERVAVPFFALFSDEAALVERLMTAEVPTLEGLGAIEWLLWKERRSEALEYGRRMLPDAGRQRRYARMLERARRGERFGLFQGYAEGFAHATVTYGLDFLQTGTKS